MEGENNNNTGPELRVITIGKRDEEFCDNSVSTSKYTLLNFIPISIGEQFRKIGNIYFLVISLFMTIGYYGSYFDSAVSPVSTVVPLMIVVAVSMTQEGIADIARHRSDYYTNSHSCLVLKRVGHDEDDDGTKSILDGRHLTIELDSETDDYGVSNTANGDNELETLLNQSEVGGTNPSRNSKVFLKEIQRSGIYPGDLVLIRNREMIPADVILLASSSERGSAYIETSSIDGETNLKLRVCPNLKNMTTYIPPVLGGDTDRVRKTHHPKVLESLEDAIARLVRISALGYPHGLKAVDNPNDPSTIPKRTLTSSASVRSIASATAKTIYKSLNNLFSKRSLDDDGQHIDEDHYISTIISETPNASVNTYTGQLVLPPLYPNGSSYKVSLNADNILLRGAALRNTEWVLGVAVFTGKDTKLVQNSHATPLKLSVLDQLVNSAIVMVIIVNIITVMIVSGIAVAVNNDKFDELWYLGYNNGGDSNNDKWPYLPDYSAPDWDGDAPNYLQFLFLFMTLFSNFVPVSLYVTMELVTFCFMYYINNDVDMYHETSNTPAVARSTNATDLGRIQYVFSDKTGTLTENIMRFKRCSVDGMVFGAPVNIATTDDDDDNASLLLEEQSQNNEKSAFHPLRHLLISGLKAEGTDDTEYDSDDVTKQRLTFNAEMFIRCMGICHTVVVEKDYDMKDDIVGDAKEKGEDGAPFGYTYQAESPDEGALVSAASLTYGYQLVSRDSSGITIQRLVPSSPSHPSSVLEDEDVSTGLKLNTITCRQLASDSSQSTPGLVKPRDVEADSSTTLIQETWTILAVNKFDSDRKRMSILVRSPDSMGSLPILFVKGADSSMLNANVCEGGQLLELEEEELGGSATLMKSTSSEDIRFENASILNMQTHLGEFATEGLRTLVLGIRILSEDECTTWLQHYENANTSLHNRKELLTKAAKDIEQKLHIVGATAIEDKLQENVPQTIANIEKAGIKLWVLTGDKRETAIEIGYSTKVLTPQMKLMEIVDGDEEFVRKATAKEFIRLVKIGKLKQYQRSSLEVSEEKNETMVQKLIHYSYKCGSYTLKIIHCQKEKKDDTITLIERRKQVRDAAEQLLQEGMGHADDHSISTANSEGLVPTSSSKTPKVFTRAQSSRKILQSNPDYNTSIESKNMKLATITALGLTKSAPGQRQGEHDSHFVEDNLSVRSFSHRSTSSSIRSKRTSDDGVGYKTSPTIFEKLFAVDRAVRQGQLQKHYDGHHHTPTSHSEETTGLVIEGAALTHLLNDAIFQEMIFAVASSCEAVVACRVSPKQKALLVKLVRTFVDGEEEPVTLAIGDGANDVGMIQEAHIGVGISGREGQQAVNSSDFAIAQFQYLENLLFVHGRRNFMRMTKVVLFSFYKNAVLVGLLTAFQYETLHSGTPVFDQYILTVLNFVAMAPILFIGFFDRDLEKEYVKKHPDMYTSGRENEHMSYRMMFRWFILTFVHIFVIYCLTVPCLRNNGMMTSAFSGLMENKDDDIPGDAEIDFVTFGTILYVVLIISLGYTVAYQTRSVIHGEVVCRQSSTSTQSIISWYDYIPWTWVGTIVLSYGLWMMFVYIYSALARNGFDEDQFNDVAYHVYNRSSIAWYIFWFVPITAAVCDVSAKLFSNFYYPTQTQIHLEMEVLKKDV